MNEIARLKERSEYVEERARRGSITGYITSRRGELLPDTLSLL